MSKFFIRMAVLIAAAGLVLAACTNPAGDDGDSGNGGGGNGSSSSSITGVYTGTINSASATLTVNSGSWVLAVPLAGVYETGTYTLSGNTATLKSGNATIGTATLNGTNLPVTLNAASGYQGTYSFTKSSDSDGNGDGGGSITGEYTGTIEGAPATLTVNSGSWTLVVPVASINETGTYTLSGNTATLKSGNTTIGTATLNGTDLTVTLNAASGNEGTYTFTKKS
jgi:hypothetical protein